MSYLFGRAAAQGSGADHRVSFAANLTIIWILLLHASAHAQDNVLTLADAVALVSEDQPQLAALALQEQAALDLARAEKELPDPKLSFGVQNLPVTGDDAFGIGREDMTMVTVEVIQEVVTRRKRDAASARMSAQAAHLAAERMLSERTIKRDVALAWLDAFEAQQRAATLRALLTQMTAEREVTAARVPAGRDRASDVLTLDSQLSSSRDELILAERDEGRARAALSRWIGEAALRPLPTRLAHESTAPLDLASIARSLDSHPALQSTERAIEAALRDVDRARAERKPDWGWELMYGLRRDDRSDMVSFEVTVGLPWNRADRQDRRIASRLAEASALHSDLSDRHRMLEAELAAIRADLAASVERLREHEGERIPTARARLDTAEAVYAGGNGSLMDVWRARRAWIETNLHHDMILAERGRALARLAWLTGHMEVLP